MATRKYLLREDQIPRHWYNILADLKTPPAPVLHPGSRKPVTPEDLAPLFPRAIVEQEMSSKREIAIPDEVRAALALWRPSPLYRAHNLERAIGTRSHVQYLAGKLEDFEYPREAVERSMANLPVVEV